MRYTAILAAFVAALSSCSTTSGGGAGERPSGDVITAEQIAEVGAQNAYDAVEMLRRQWLTSRGARSTLDPSLRYPVVFLDEIELGELDQLRRISSEEIREIRFIDGRQAVPRYGMEYGAGIIHVITH
jgi:hypothetical protein